LNRQQIESLVPHRAPMLLIDAVLERTDTQIRCRKTFHGDEFFFQGHYPGYPLVPGVILCEASMQAGAILLASYSGSGVPVATRMNDVRFRKMVRPGDTIEIAVELVERLADAFFLKGKVTRGPDTVLRLEFACTAAQVEEAETG
jgi:3-hydroxyacyl-[acyl-carrier-protein] dehydratase